jgi:amino acid adenylation domain-containing protein
MGQSGDQSLTTWTIVSRFNRIAEEFSQRTAVVCHDERLSYAQLNEQANRFAHCLIDLGVKSEEPVGLAIPKSCAQIAAVLGILKAGGAYVPLVDNQPLARLRTILDDVGCRFVLAQDGYLDELASDCHQRITAESCQSHSSENLDRDIHADQLAYILYTSGSTGTPKGVMIEHSGVIRLVCGQDYLPFGPDFHYLFAAPMSFDVSTLEIFTPLLHGAKLAIVPEGELDPMAIRDLCHNEKVQSTCMAFGLFSSLFESCPTIFEHMPIVAVGGEQVIPSTIAKAQDKLPYTRFINAYGPTEATMLALIYDIPSPLGENCEAIPIGDPLNRMQAFVLDNQLNEVAQGETGELCLAGIGLARGYWNRPEQTTDQFVMRKCADGSEQRIYRTGDLAKMDKDGRVICLGRMDDQVKIRGYRIELGEIESCAVSERSVVSTAAVVFGSGTNQSIGLAITTSSDDLDESIVRTALAEKLPAYMMPTSIRRVDSIPLSPNGKVDRAALGSLFNADESGSLSERTGEPLQTETERTLAELFSMVLGVSPVFADDQFLRIGGHSLRAVVLSSRIRDRFGVSIPISTIYQCDSLRPMARWIEEQAALVGNAEVSKELALKPVDQGERCLLSFNQQRLWMLHELQPDDQSYLIRIQLKHEGAINRSCLDDAWNLICKRHAMLRARIETTDGHPWQIIDDRHPSSVCWRSCENDSVESVRRKMRQDSSIPFDLGESPMIRCTVYTQRDHALVLIAMHHIISDAWSCEVLQRELSKTYSALVAGKLPMLDELPISYTDFAYWQRQLPQTDGYEADLAYWVDRLSGIDSVELPTDFTRGSMPSSDGAQLSKRIDRATVQRLRDAADQLGVTPNVFLLAIFKVWLFRLTVQESITVGTPIANREWTEIEGVIGFFMETAALSTRLNTRDTLAQTIASVSQTTLEAFDHRDVPFQHIVDAVHAQASNGRNPFFEVFFNHITMNIHSSDADDPLGFANNEIENKTAKFDLTCYIFDHAEQIDIVFNYRKSLFTDATIERLLDQYIRLLCTAPENLQTPLSALPILSPDESVALAFESEMSIPDSGLIQDFVYDIVKTFPDHPAVIWESGTINYAQLWARSSAILCELQQKGVHAGDRVLISSTSPAELGAATLAVLRVGGIFVPIDPYWPDKRFEQVAQAASPACVLTDHTLTDRFAALAHGASVISLGSVSEKNPGDIVADVHPTDPAYMLFTSGSTGEPKGVVQSHAGVVSHMHTFAYSMKLSPDDRLLQVSSPAFDAAIMDMFSAWFTGAALCVCDLQVTDHNALASFMGTNAISVYHSAPSVFRWFTGALDDGYPLSSVRCVVLGGEPMTKSDADELNDHFPGCELFINGLGLSESSLTLQLRVHPDELSQYTRWIPVGFPPECSRVRLVDADGHPTQLTGEIEIESSRIALGYWNPESMSITPIGQQVPDSAALRFRTGDLGTMRSDGSIDHIGRLDHQVQIHGCRVETEEVSAAIKALPGITDAAVISNRTSDGDHELCGYIVTEQEMQLTELDLRENLSALLPGYMVPAQFKRVEAIPRVGGGKLDRHTLTTVRTRAFEHTHQAKDIQTSELLTKVRRAFADVLEYPELQVNEGFFKLGGNSLKAIRVFSILKKSTGTKLPISTIYRASTPAQLAQAIENHREQHAEPVLVTLSNAGEKPPVYLFPGVGGHPLGFGPMVERMDHTRPCIGIQLPEVAQVIELGQSLQTMATWLIDQMKIGPNERAPDMIGYSFGGALAMEIAIQLQERGSTPGRVILLDAHLPRGLPKKGKLGTIITHFKRLIRGSDMGRLEYVRTRLSPGRANEYRAEPGDRAQDQELKGYKELALINRRMLSSYKPSETYKSPVCLVRALQPEWLRFHVDDGYNGWSIAADPEQVQSCSIHTTHMRLFKQGAVEELAQIVDELLTKNISDSSTHNN